MRKNFFSKASLVAAASFIGMVFTSCSDQKYVEPKAQYVEVPGPTQYVNVPVEKIIDNTVVWDGEHILFNGATALTASVTPDSLVLTKPAAEHAAAVITSSSPNRWEDSNGNGFTGNMVKYDLNGLTIGATIEPATPFSTITSIHPKVSMVKGDFRLKGFAELTETGKRSNFDLKVENGTYFLSDTTVEVRQITNTQIEIQYDTVYVDVVRDSLIEKTITEYVNIDKNAAVVNGFGFGSIDFSYGDKSFSFRMDLDSINILREESVWGVATKTDENRNGFDLSDKQHGKYTVRENGIKIESVSLAKSEIPFARLNDTFKYGTATVNVTVSYTDKSGKKVTRDFTVGASYFHELAKADVKPEVVTPEITTEYTYTVDSTRTAVKDSEGNLTGEKMRITVKRNEDGKTWKIQFMAWETGLLCPTITGTQVGSNQQLRATTATPEAYTADGWSGTDTSREGFTVVASSKQYKFRTAFKAVPGFGQSEESVAECNIVFGTRKCTFTDPENTSFTFTISADGINSNETSVKITFDQVGSDEQAKAEVNGRGLEYEYIGTHYLTVEQYVGGKLVNTQSRNEQLLYPKN